MVNIDGTVAHGQGAATRSVATRPEALAEPPRGPIERMHAHRAAGRRDKGD